jgi:ABC-type phosphate transport system auxiliary subunit
MTKNEVTQDELTPVDGVEGISPETSDILHEQSPAPTETAEREEGNVAHEDSSESIQKLISEIASVTEQAEKLTVASEQSFSDDIESLKVSADSLGLNSEEQSAVLNSIGFGEREEKLRDQLTQITQRLRGAIERATSPRQP